MGGFCTKTRRPPIAKNKKPLKKIADSNPRESWLDAEFPLVGCLLRGLKRWVTG
jgi:hypothetical protein